jgi:hypothetical protein
MRCILPLAFCAFCLMIGNAALATVTELLEREEIEMCHRLPEGNDTLCGKLPH